MARTKVSKGFTRLYSALHARLYKLSGGRLGSKMQDGAIVLLTTIGRKTGKRRTKPLIAINHEAGWVVVASFSGHDEHPAWYLNLRAEPRAMLRVGRVDHTVVACDVAAEARAALWDRLDGVYADYRAHRQVADRNIPLVHLTPA